MFTLLLVSFLDVSHRGFPICYTPSHFQAFDINMGVFGRFLNIGS
jgi:hypothetical protein